MKKYTLPYFGEINTSNLEENKHNDYEANYRTTTNINGIAISLDINFKNNTIDDEALETLKTFLENIENQLVQNKKYINEDYKLGEDGDVQEYLEFHIEELEDELSERKLVDFENKTIKPKKQLLEKLVVERIGIYPDCAFDSENYATFDYTIEGNIYEEDRRRTFTDQILCINTDALGNLEYFSWES